MITELLLHNFKAWKGETRIPLGSRVTGIFGTNSSGKTSILQALLLLKQTAEASDRNITLAWRGGMVDVGSFYSALNNESENGILEIGLTWKTTNIDKENELIIYHPEDPTRVFLKPESIAFATEIGNGKGDVYVNKLSYKIDNWNISLKKNESKYQLFANQSEPQDPLTGDKFAFKRSLGRKWELKNPVKCYGFPDAMQVYYQNANFLSTLSYEFEKILKSVFYLGPLRGYPERDYKWNGETPAGMGKRGEQVVDALLAGVKNNVTISRGRGKKRISLQEQIAIHLKDMGLVASFSVRPLAAGSDLYQVWVRQTPGSKEVLITEVGFGVSQILPVLVLCYYAPPGSILLIEQPEIHLHPRAQAVLADVLIEASERQRVQIMVESHSEHLLRRMQRRVAEQKLAPEDLRLYFCDNTIGNATLTTLKVNEFGGIENWPEGFWGDPMEDIFAMEEIKLKHLLAAQQ